MAVRNRFSELQGEIASWRQHLHQNPELEFDTFKTSEFVENTLKSIGCDEICTGIGRTGVVGVIHGKKQSSDKVVGLRADMDALPIQEATGSSYASNNSGKMHACGHDGHTAMLLGAAKYMAETRNFNGSLVVIFQPAEEKGGGGKVMVDDGLIDKFRIQEVYGMHNMPGLPVGQFAIRSGPFFAAADTVSIKVHGQGGHGAMPHKTVDTTVVTCSVVNALQTIVSRNVDPQKAAVLSICAIRTDTFSHNVIPQTVEMLGTIRSMDSDVREMLFDRIRTICAQTVAAFEAKASVQIETGYPVMINADAQTAYAINGARRVSANVEENCNVVMGAEDFAFMLDACPGAYILTGNGDSAPLHHPEYDFNDDAIPAGCSWWVEIAESRLSV